MKKRGRPRDSGRAAIEEEEEVNCLSDTWGKCIKFWFFQNEENTEDLAALFSCSVCELKFNEVLKLIKHLKNTHDITVHMCEFCGGDYENEESLLAHVKQTHPPDEDSETDEEVSLSGLERF